MGQEPCRNMALEVLVEVNLGLRSSGPRYSQILLQVPRAVRSNPERER